MTQAVSATGCLGDVERNLLHALLSACGRGGTRKFLRTCEYNNAHIWVIARVIKTADHLSGGLRPEGVAPLWAIYSYLRSQPPFQQGNVRWECAGAEDV